MTLQEQKKILEEIADLPEEAFPNLLQIIHLFKESVLQTQKEMLALSNEFAGWDKLSDEALVEFEKGL